MADVERLRRGRNAAKGWLKKAGESLVKALESKKPDRYEIETLVSLFDKRLGNFESSQSALELEQSEEETETDQSAAGYLDQLMLVRANAAKLLRKMEAMDAAETEPQSGLAKLPRLDLPHFSGKPEEWPPFWEAFTVAVDKTNLPDVTKLTYLRSLLKGEALRCVD